MLRIRGLDHIVLRSPDIERSLDFYCRVLGLGEVRVEEWRAGDAPFPSVRISPDTLIDLIPLEKEPEAAQPQRLDHFCLTLEPTDLDAVVAALGAAGVEVTERGRRFGALGMAESVYFLGPEGVRTELRVYPEGEA